MRRHGTGVDSDFFNNDEKLTKEGNSLMVGCFGQSFILIDATPHKA